MDCGKDGVHVTAAELASRHHGGHLLFYGYEAVARKPLNERLQLAGFKFGLALLMMLMAFVFYNDISSIVRRTLGGG